MRRQPIATAVLLTALALAAAHAVAGDPPSDLLFRDSFENEPGTNPPTFNPVDGLGVLLGDTLVEVIDAEDIDLNDVLTYDLISGPGGLTVEGATGRIEWTPEPADLGDNPVTLQATDVGGLNDQITFPITVIRPNASPGIAPIGTQYAAPDVPYALAVDASDPDPGDSLAYSLDESPTGMTIDAGSGLIEWTPTAGQAGAHPAVVRVVDPTGAGDTEPFTVIVGPPNTAPTLDPLPDRGTAPGLALVVALDADDPDGDPLSFALLQAPSGMGLDPTTDQLQWTPTTLQLGDHLVTVEVDDGRGGRDAASFTVRVDMNRAPVAFDDAWSVERTDTLTVDAPGVLANDTDPNFDPLTALLVADAQRGTLALAADGGFEYTPDNPAGTIDFTVKWANPVTGAGGQDQPLIGDFDGDGVPEILVRTLESVLAVRGDTGAETFSVASERSLLGGSAFADIDLDGRAEFIYIGQENGRSGSETGRKLIALEHDGGLKWISEALPVTFRQNGTPVQDGFFTNAKITIADLDADGTPEILVGHGVNRFPITEGGTGFSVFDNQGRKRFTAFAPGTPSNGASARVEVVDLDLDGTPEIVTGSAAFTNTGEVIWSLDTGDIPLLTNTRPRGSPIAANLDNDPYPELVRERSNGEILALNHDGTVHWQVSTFVTSNGGTPPLLVADVDNDGLAEVLVTDDGNFGPNNVLSVLNGADGSVKWSFTRPGLNLFEGTPAVIDMDRDGFNEVLVLERDRDIIVLDGRDGSVVFEFDSPTGGAPGIAMPIFADVDLDGHSELVLLGQESPAVGVWVFESPSDDWPPQRAVFNQWNYHVTNINPDGTVPANEPAHWLLPGLNLNRINERLPEERIEDRDFFTYRASDGELESNLARVDLTILPPNNPPRILSSPRTLASPNFEYEYRVLAVDADVGETLTWALAEAPPGMSVDATGRIAWTPGPGDLGPHDVVVQVTDSIGFIDAQAFVVTVEAAVLVPNVTGSPEGAAIAALAAAGLAADPVNPVFDPLIPAGIVAEQDPAPGVSVAAGTPIRIDVSQGPPPVIVPDLLSMERAEAEAKLAAAGLGVGGPSFANREDVPAGLVFAQDPVPGSTAPQGDPVALSVSGGPRVGITLARSVLAAGESTNVDVTVFEPDGTPAAPQPGVVVSIEADPGAFSGPLPQLAGGTLTAQPGGEGAFRVRAVVDGSGETGLREAAVNGPLTEDGDDDLFSTFSEQLGEFAALTGALQIAVGTNDLPAVAALDADLAALRDAIDARALRVTSPIAPAEGRPPTAAAMAAAGFPAQYDDVVWVDVLLDLYATTRTIADLVADDATPDSVLTAFNQQLVEQAAALRELEPGLYGAMDGLSVALNLVTSRIPELVLADIDAIRAALADAGLTSGGAAPRSARFTLGGLMNASAIRSQIISDIYQPIMADLIVSGVLLAAGDLLAEYINGGTLAGVITASSQSIHVFGIPNSILEGNGLDTMLADGNIVWMIGPNAIEDVLGALGGDIPESNGIRGVNGVANLISETIENAIDRANAIKNVIDGANSTPGDLGRGCFLSADPACSQLIYPDGFASVYEKQGGLQLWSPILIIVHSVRDGNLSLTVAPFLPTAEAED